MGPASRCFNSLVYGVAILAFMAISSAAGAQTCQTANDMDAAVRSAITNAGQRYFDMVAKGDSASLRQNSIPSVAANFAAIENTIKESQPQLSGAQGTIKSSFLLDAQDSAPNQQDEFWCGVFNRNGQTPTSAAFYFYGLPPAKYAVVLMDANSPKGRTMFSEVLQRIGNDWKFAGLYIKSAQVNGHDSDWFLNQARQYKAKGQLHDAWFYYRMAISLISPMQAQMSTLATDKIYDEAEPVHPKDLPGNSKPVDFASEASTYKVTEIFPQPVGNELDLVVKYQSANVANPNLAYQDNVNVMKALVTKYPEVREAFNAVVARAVDTTGHDYGTLLAMKDIK
ncbi:MAG TPA: hypothetical protein VMU05_24090 [Dongiaceae bacterium]|nr:hypothetical protein [Dongiaceae bacterium]